MSHFSLAHHTEILEIVSHIYLVSSPYNCSIFLSIIIYTRSKCNVSAADDMFPSYIYVFEGLGKAVLVPLG